MSDRLKRILFIVFFALFVIGIGTGLYFVFFRSNPSPGAGTAPGETTSTAGGTLPPSGAGGSRPIGGTEGTGTLPESGTVPGAEGTGANGQPRTSLLVESVAQQVAPTAQGDGARFYNPVDGKFYRALPDGRVIALGDVSFPNVEAVTWGNTSDQAILTFPDGSNIHYDFQTKSQTTLPQHWDDFNFSTDDQNIIAKSEAVSPESRYLVIADPDGKNPHSVQALGDNGDKVHADWTGNDQVVAYSETGDALGYDRQQIILIGKNNENFRGLVVEGRGFQPLWSPTGQKVLYSVWTVDNGYKPELWVSGGSPDNVNMNRVKLEIQTWADKCAWASDDLLFCAVPENLPQGAGLQPDLFATLEDRIVRIDLKTGQKTDLGKPDGNPSVRSPVVTKDGSALLYTDASTGKLYSFNLD
jgi:hypothetical protein